MYIFAVYSPKKVSVCEKAVGGCAGATHKDLSLSSEDLHVHTVYTHTESLFPQWFNNHIFSAFVECLYIHAHHYTHHSLCVGWCREVLGDGAETEGHTLLHGPDRHPDADQEGR